MTASNKIDMLILLLLGILEFIPVAGWMIAPTTIITFGILAHCQWIWMAVLLGVWRIFIDYHSAVNYTSLGYGDLIMTPPWRLLGPLETANGMLMFGVSTAMIFAVIQRLAETRFVDLKE